VLGLEHGDPITVEFLLSYYRGGKRPNPLLTGMSVPPSLLCADDEAQFRDYCKALDTAGEALRTIDAYMRRYRSDSDGPTRPPGRQLLPTWFERIQELGSADERVCGGADENVRPRDFIDDGGNQRSNQGD